MLWLVKISISPAIPIASRAMSSADIVAAWRTIALAAAKAMVRHAATMSAEDIAREAIGIAGDIDIFTKHNIISETL